MKIRLGTRASLLARTQSGWVADQLMKCEPGLQIEEVLIETGGDQDQETPLHETGAPGVFTAEVERALQDGRVDLAVHSLKDLPIQQPEGLVLAAIPVREDPRDAWISADYAGVVDMPAGSIVATGSLRRRSQILNRYPELVVEGIRGNIDTRMEKYRDRGASGLLLAAAGLLRLGRRALIRSMVSVTEMTPAPGQGALALEVREDDDKVREVVSRLDDSLTRQCVVAERSLLSALGGGCHLPVGALAGVSGGTLSLCGVLGALDGKNLVRLSAEGSVDEPELIGHDLARLIRKSGGDAILEQLDEGLET
ncbi:MAG: hydroxymethylbilane synthase [Planctomycetota bacterium]|nr:hydroxymethylbilane synthase [Planctomycetota bacterium]